MHIIWISQCFCFIIPQNFKLTFALWRFCCKLNRITCECIAEQLSIRYNLFSIDGKFTNKPRNSSIQNKRFQRLKISITSQENFGALYFKCTKHNLRSPFLKKEMSGDLNFCLDRFSGARWNQNLIFIINCSELWTKICTCSEIRLGFLQKIWIEKNMN